MIKTAINEPKLTIISKDKPLIESPNKCLNMRTCPLEEIGIGSVNPWIKPRKINLNNKIMSVIGSILSPLYLNTTSSFGFKRVTPITASMNSLDREEGEMMTTDNNHIYDLCEDHMHAYVLAEMVDGSKVDGIITGLDDENVYFAIPINSEIDNMRLTGEEEERQYGGWQGGGYNYGYPGYGYGFQGYGFRPRFRRLILPLTALAAISLLPWY